MLATNLKQALSETQLSSLGSLPASRQNQETVELKRSIRLRQRRYFQIKNSTADGYRNVVLDPTRLGDGMGRWDSLYASWSRPLDVLSTRQIPVRTSSVIFPVIPRTLSFQQDSVFSPMHLDRSSSHQLRSQSLRTAGIRCIAGNHHCNIL